MSMKRYIRYWKNRASYELFEENSLSEHKCGTGKGQNDYPTQSRHNEKKKPTGRLLSYIVYMRSALPYEPVKDTFGCQAKEFYACQDRTPRQAHAFEIPAKLKNVSNRFSSGKATRILQQDLKIPNWVAWELTPEKLVKLRTDKFLPTPDLPEHEAVTTDDYKEPAWTADMCPAGDNRWHSAELRKRALLRQNLPLEPQSKPWRLERTGRSCRRWAIRRKARYTLYGRSYSRRPTSPISANLQGQCPKHSSRSFCITDSNPPKPSASFTKSIRQSSVGPATSNTVDEVNNYRYRLFPTPG